MFVLVDVDVTVLRFAVLWDVNVLVGVTTTVASTLEHTVVVRGEGWMIDVEVLVTVLWVVEVEVVVDVNVGRVVVVVVVVEGVSV